MPDPPVHAGLDTIRRAYDIAIRDLRACYNPDGMAAGPLNFNAYWTRDGFWAAFGALALGDLDPVKAHLDTFIRFQMASGELPVRIEQYASNSSSTRLGYVYAVNAAGLAEHPAPAR
jgi:glycogen debranching enzyme